MQDKAKANIKAAREFLKEDVLFYLKLAVDMENNEDLNNIFLSLGRINEQLKVLIDGKDSKEEKSNEGANSQ